MFGLRSFKTWNADRREAADRKKRIRKFIEQVDFLVELFKWDSSLPEFSYLKDNAAKFIDNPMYTLRELDPRDAIQMEGECVTVIDRSAFGGVMRPEHVAEHHVPHLLQIAYKVVVDGESTTIYDQHNMAVVSFMSGAVSCYPNTVYMMRRYTGQQLHHLRRMRDVRRITVTRQDDGAWAEPVYEHKAPRKTA